jgi:glycosyltransferase involved in cell wall biosynthesis
MCGRADGVSYVTEHSLQAKYPPSRDALATHYSSVALKRDDYAEQPRVSFASQPVRLVAVGSLSQLYKGPDVLLDALTTVKETLAISCVWVGSGRFLDPMRRRAAELGLGDCVEFIGPVERRTSMRRLLDTADVFVMPSRVEGLPRAMIEAMARGLPCIGTRVGGIPELLHDDALIEPESAEELAQKIIEFASNPQDLIRFSDLNLRVARQHAEEILGPRRERLYSFLRQAAGTASQPRRRQ